MSSRTKIASMFLITFIVGMIVGALINGAIHKSRITKIKEMRKKDGFTQYIIHTIEPNEVQKEKVKEIMNRFSEKMNLLRRQSRIQFDAIRDSMITELSNVLTEKQMEKLNKEFKEEKNRRKNRRRPPENRKKSEKEK